MEMKKSIKKNNKTSQISQKKWISVILDKLYLETQTNRYFLILKPTSDDSNKSIFLSIDNVLEEMLLNNVLNRNETMKKIFRQMNIKIIKIRILKRINSDQSSECFIKQGLFTKTIKISTVDAIRFSFENNVLLEVPVELVKANHLELTEGDNLNSKIDNNPFYSRFIGRDLYNNNNEVIM